MNLREYAIQHYLSVGAKTEDDFDGDFAIAGRLLVQLKRDDIVGKEANLPLCINYIITFFNLFEPSAAIVILDKAMQGDTVRSKLWAFLVFLNKSKLADVVPDEKLLMSLRKHYGVNSF